MQEADIAPGGVSSSITVYDKCDVSIPWLIQAYRMIVPWPEEQHNNDIIAAARPFHSEVSYKFSYAFNNILPYSNG